MVFGWGIAALRYLLRVNSTKIVQFAAGQKIKYRDPSLRSG